MSKGYNLPDNVDPLDPNAPWMGDEDATCIVCGSSDVVAWIGDESFCQDCLDDEEADDLDLLDDLDPQ